MCISQRNVERLVGTMMLLFWSFNSSHASCLESLKPAFIIKMYLLTDAVSCWQDVRCVSIRLYRLCGSTLCSLFLHPAVSWSPSNLTIKKRKSVSSTVWNRRCVSVFLGKQMARWSDWVDSIQSVFCCSYTRCCSIPVWLWMCHRATQFCRPYFFPSVLPVFSASCTVVLELLGMNLFLWIISCRRFSPAHLSTWMPLLLFFEGPQSFLCIFQKYTTTEACNLRKCQRPFNISQKHIELKMRLTLSLWQ